MLPGKRFYNLHFLGFEKTGAIVEVRNGKKFEIPFHHNADKNEIMISVEKKTGEDLRIRFVNGMKMGCNPVAKLCFDVLDKAGIPYNLKEEIYEKIKCTENVKRLEVLRAMKLDHELYEALKEKITAKGE